LEVDFFRSALRRIKEGRPSNTASGASVSNGNPGVDATAARQTDGGTNVPIDAGEPGGILPYVAVEEPEAEDMTVRDAIQKVALDHRRRYGYRRITRELRRRGMVVNHKRVLTHQLWVAWPEAKTNADLILCQGRLSSSPVVITYIRLQVEFVYLAVVIDRFSRRVVGWSLERTLAARLAVAALQQAIAQRQPGPGLVHHSDRGFQYASREYVDLLQAHRMEPSMSRPANPYDNAACESFMKTLKQEEIYCHEYRDMPELSAHLEEFLDTYYNRRRLHSALGYRTPEEFEQDKQTQPEGTLAGAARMRFFQNPSGSGNAAASQAGCSTPEETRK
jgi:putative transposase